MAPDILVVGINYHPETTGIAPYTTAMAEALARDGRSVHVVTGIPHYPSWHVQDSRYTGQRRWQESVDGLPVTRVRHHVPPAASLRGRMRMESGFFWGARREVAAIPSRAIIAVTPSLSGAAAAVSAAQGRPVGVVVQDLTGAAATQSGSAGSRTGRYLSAMEYAVLRRASVVGIITPRFGAQLAAHGIGEERLMNVANFSHVAQADAGVLDARDKLGWDYDGQVVVHTGNMGMKQGLESVVAAARMADDQQLPVDFVLVGDGNQRRALVDLAQGCQRLHLVDPVDEADYPYVLAAADVLLLNERPGVKEMSLPSKLTSYVTAARPIVAAVEPGGITHNVLADHRAAVLVPPGSPAPLLGALTELAMDDGRRAELVANAQRLGQEEYGRPSAEQRYRAFAERLLAADLQA